MALIFDDPFRAEDAHILVHRTGSTGLFETNGLAVATRAYDRKVRISQDISVIAGLWPRSPGQLMRSGSLDYWRNA
jgi:hypothetical protein